MTFVHASYVLRAGGKEKSAKSFPFCVPRLGEGGGAEVIIHLPFFIEKGSRKAYNKRTKMEMTLLIFLSRL